MPDSEPVSQFTIREDIREHQFKHVWTKELNTAFTDIAKYYDRANHIASLGMWNRFRREFLATIQTASGQNALDVCAGTNAIGLALLDKQPDLKVTAIDRSEAMQAVGQVSARKQGKQIESIIDDVHILPFPDHHFDIVTLQFASRHLRVMDVAAEVLRVLKPGGFFYHCDMLRPGNKTVEVLYYGYLKMCLTSTALIFHSNSAAMNCRAYFVNALRMFYSADEFSELLEQLGYQNVAQKTLLAGMIGFHKAMKPHAPSLT